MRMLLTACLCLLLGFGSAQAEEQNHCQSADHARGAFPLLKKLTSPEVAKAAASKRVSQMIASQPDRAKDRETMIELLSNNMSSKPYKAGLLNLICKHFTVEDFALLNSRQPLEQAKHDELNAKLRALQPEIDALVAKTAIEHPAENPL